MTSEEVSKFIGKIVAIRWKDPSELIRNIDTAPKGRAGLATWVEWGLVDDVTEDVLRFRHGEVISAQQADPDEANFGYIHTVLIDSMVQLRPWKAKKGRAA